MPEVQVDGARLHYQDSGGDGPAIVFAHGLLWSTAMWRFQVAAFRDRYRCLAFDFRTTPASRWAASSACGWPRGVPSW